MVLNKKQANVLLIVTDHWAAENLGVAGNEAIITPGLNEIAMIYGIASSNKSIC